MAKPALGLILERDGSDVDQLSYDTSSLTPDDTKLVFLWAIGTDNPPPGQPSISGTNGWSTTWNHVLTVDHNFRTHSLFWCIPSSTTAGVISITYPGGTSPSSAIWSVEEWVNIDQTTPVVQSDGPTDSSVTELAGVLSAFSDSENATLMGVSMYNGSSITNEGGSWTAVGTEFATTAPIQTFHAHTLAGEDTTPTLSWTGSTNPSGIAVELASDSPAGGTANPWYYYAQQ